MECKQCMKTREVKKHKARLNIDGSKMRPGQHCEQTYSHVASWNSIQMLLALPDVNDWHTKQLDFVLAFPQAPVACDLHMKFPKGFEIENGNSHDCTLQLHHNVCGQKHTGRAQNKCLTVILVHMLKFEQ